MYKSPAVCGLIYNTIGVEAPEDDRCIGESVHDYDPFSADLWSLACLIFEVATGERAFECAPDVAFDVHGSVLQLRKQQVSTIMETPFYANKDGRLLVHALNGVIAMWTGKLPTQLQDGPEFSTRHHVQRLLLDTDWNYLRCQVCVHRELTACTGKVLPESQGAEVKDPPISGHVIKANVSCDARFLRSCADSQHGIPVASMAMEDSICRLELFTNQLYEEHELAEIQLVMSSLLVRHRCDIVDPDYDIARIEDEMALKITNLLCHRSSAPGFTRRIEAVGKLCRLHLLKCVCFPEPVRKYLRSWAAEVVDQEKPSAGAVMMEKLQPS